jgi:predicted RNase H-like nuclease
MNTTCIIGFDSAWTGKQGAVCALSLGADQGVAFEPPLLTDFYEALSFIGDQIQRHDYCLVAVDQPTIVPNETGCRPVDRVAASLISYMGGGVQPANRSKRLLFGDGAPFWGFKQKLGAHEAPEESRSAANGLFLIEVFPALALAGFNPAFGDRLRGPKYNPAKRRRFRFQDWCAVIETIRVYAATAGLEPLQAWTRYAGTIGTPRKADQDRLDAVLCAMVGYHWRAKPREASIMIGNLRSGYMITPSHPRMRARLASASEKLSVPLR